MVSYRQGVIIVLHGEQGYLLCHKSGAPEQEWYFPAGGQHEGEDLLETFYRELMEELRLTPESVGQPRISTVVHRYLWGEKFKLKTGFDGQEQHIIVAELLPGARPTPDQEELDRIKFVPAERLLAAIAHEDLRATMRDVEARGELR